MVAELLKINAFDIELFEYAQALAARRMLYIKKYLPAIKHYMRPLSVFDPQQTQKCGENIAYSWTLPINLSLGIHRPPYHKGPMNITKILLNTTDDDEKKVVIMEPKRPFLGIRVTDPRHSYQQLIQQTDT